jgi:hypothetical protein
MEYISVEEFLKQNYKVQKTLKEWWLDNFSFGKICYNERYEKCAVIDKWQYKFTCISSSLEGEIVLSFDEVIPLFTEGQLRQFIEDKTGGSPEFTKIFSKNSYDVELYKYDEKIEDAYLYKEYNNIGKSVLEAYWNTSLNILTELIENDLNMFKIGEKVKIINTGRTGKIIEIRKDSKFPIIVKTEAGYRVNCNVKDLKQIE